MTHKRAVKVRDGAHCEVVGGAHKGKSGTVADIKTSKTGHVTITVVPSIGARFKTLAKNVVVRPKRDAVTMKAPRSSKPRKSPSPPKAGATGNPASRLIDQRIRDLGGWRGATLARMRELILAADPEMTEEWKWMVPVWSHHGIVCTGEAYTKVVKLTFAKGAWIPDPSHLFNSSLEGNTRRAIDLHEGEKVNASAFKALVKAAVAHNGAKAR